MKPRILLIDDEDMTTTIKFVEVFLGYEVVWVKDLNEARRELATNKYDGVLIDGHLTPNREERLGVRFAEQLKAKGESEFKFAIYSSDVHCQRPGIPFIDKYSEIEEELPKLLAAS